MKEQFFSKQHLLLILNKTVSSCKMFVWCDHKLFLKYIYSFLKRIRKLTLQFFFNLHMIIIVLCVEEPIHLKMGVTVMSICFNKPQMC